MANNIENVKTATVTTNTEHNGIELVFGNKPTRATLDELKKHGFRWHGQKKLWYAKNTPERFAFASSLCGKDLETFCAEPTPAQNKYGVKVGDIFSASWGYDQTNNDFFQVVALVGESCVRVREVYLPLIESSPVSSMSEDRLFSVSRDLLPPVRYSVFIKDQEKGDLKHLKSFAADGRSFPQFRLSSFCNAHYCAGDTVKVYESWYA